MDLIPKRPGGVEVVDVDQGRVVVRHPDTQNLRFIHLTHEQAGAVANHIDKIVGYEDLNSVLSDVSEGIRQELITGLFPDEIKKAAQLAAANKGTTN